MLKRWAAVQTGLLSFILLHWPQVLSSALGRRSSSDVWMSDKLPPPQIPRASDNLLLKKRRTIMDHSFGGSVRGHLAPLVWMADEAKSPQQLREAGIMVWISLYLRRQGSVDLKPSCERLKKDA